LTQNNTNKKAGDFSPAELSHLPQQFTAGSFKGKSLSMSFR